GVATSTASTSSRSTASSQWSTTVPAAHASHSDSADARVRLAKTVTSVPASRSAGRWILRAAVPHPTTANRTLFMRLRPPALEQVDGLAAVHLRARDALGAQRGGEALGERRVRKEPGDAGRPVAVGIGPAAAGQPVDRADGVDDPRLVGAHRVEDAGQPAQL